MKNSRVCWLVVLCLVCTAAAFADSVQDPIPDPKIVIRGVQSGGAPSRLSGCPPEGCTQVGMNFEFAVPEKGRGTLFFTNASGKNWTSLRLVERGVPASAITCGQNLFLSCTVTTLENGAVEILLAGVNGKNPKTGIAAGSNFAIGFVCVDKNCWPGGLQFQGHASAAPEPATLALLGTGLVAIYSRRKRWMKSSKA